MRLLPLTIVAALSLVLVACGVDVPGGSFPPTTPTPSGPTPTPVIMGAPQVKPTNTPVPPPPTPTPRPPAATPTPSPEPTTAPVESNATTPVTEAATTEAPMETATSEAVTPATATSAPAESLPTTTEMTVIPAGPFTMGYDQGLDDEKPPHEVDLPEYQIDLFETTNAQFAAFVDATGYQTEAEQAGSARVWRDEWTDGEDNHPVVRVSWQDAMAYCEWAGKRLPTEAEWEKAARGTEALSYPWGNEYEAGKANDRNSGIRGTVAVGSYGEGASPYGVFDMAGNVREWTADAGYFPYPGNNIPSGYYGDTLRVLRGGGWFDNPPDLRTTRRNPTAPSAANWDIGFRCVK
jgi:formylglycine-generating enzyme required for sulfatase activity